MNCLLEYNDQSCQTIIIIISVMNCTLILVDLYSTFIWSVSCNQKVNDIQQIEYVDQKRKISFESRKSMIITQRTCTSVHQWFYSTVVPALGGGAVRGGRGLLGGCGLWGERSLISQYSGGGSLPALDWGEYW